MAGATVGAGAPATGGPCGDAGHPAPWHLDGALRPWPAGAADAHGQPLVAAPGAAPLGRALQLLVELLRQHRLSIARGHAAGAGCAPPGRCGPRAAGVRRARLALLRSEEHTSELQSPCNLVCRLLLEKKKKN